ncbi:PAS domain-containing protein [Mariniflexile sp.]|uniref:PAS domain-containing sensor histidine kinase n=1 Tax=Mariniflexile sp. TaxID=1979402 RepID=UPI0035667F0D
MNTQKSAEMVVHTLQVYNAIGNLTNHYSKAQSEEFRKDLIHNESSDEIFEAYKQEGKSILDSLKVLTQDNSVHAIRIKPLNTLLNSLYNQLTYLKDTSSLQGLDALNNDQEYRLKINKTLNDIKVIKERMLADEEHLMKERKVNYSFYKSLTPSMLLVLGFFALSVFLISFFRIYTNKLKVRKSEAFLKNVLATTDNIVNYYEPVFNNSKEIIDFKIVFANDCNRDYLGLEPEALVGETVLNAHPLHSSKIALEELITSYNENIKVVFDRQIDVEGKKMWFHSLVTPLAEGVLLTSRNSTAEEEAKEKELNFIKQLENQNLKLLDNRALLTNIFKSISHIVMSFKSIRTKEGKIIDFEVLFVNDKISPLTGDLPDNLKNKKMSEVFPTTFKSGVFENLVEAVETDKPVNYETPFTKDGTLRWFRATAIKLGDGVTVTTRDVTEDKEKANQLINLNEELIIQNSILTGAERIAKIGNFIWHMESGESEISDNFYEMLGCRPKEFDSNFETYRSFVHPEDLEEYDRIGAETISERKITEHTYRIITKQGVVKYFKTNGQFITKNGKEIMIGVVQDVTETIVAEEKLLESNLELKNKNAELESFNRVASHDLQEPLRKIQLFALRIQDNEAENFSDRSKDYFSKVIKAVNRMQSLIENLLAYSKINITKDEFETIDLNQLLDKVQEDITTSIQSSNATITADRLPEIKGVTFQIEQLFTNLLTNAIKYRKEDESPILQIKYSKILATDLSNLNAKDYKYYHKIAFKDNGIGFKQQYADKIFEVFQRLHQKTEYSGTGIGLAICKKILENHNGYITAFGTEAVGSEFVIYFPVQ